MGLSTEMRGPNQHILHQILLAQTALGYICPSQSVPGWSSRLHGWRIHSSQSRVRAQGGFSFAGNGESPPPEFGHFVRHPIYINHYIGEPRIFLDGVGVDHWKQSCSFQESNSQPLHVGKVTGSFIVNKRILAEILAPKS